MARRPDELILLSRVKAVTARGAVRSRQPGLRYSSLASFLESGQISVTWKRVRFTSGANRCRASRGPSTSRSWGRPGDAGHAAHGFHRRRLPTQTATVRSAVYPTVQSSTLAREVHDFAATGVPKHARTGSPRQGRVTLAR